MVILLMLAGGICLAFGILHAYQAPNGSPLKDMPSMRSPQPTASSTQRCQTLANRCEAVGYRFEAKFPKGDGPHGWGRRTPHGGVARDVAVPPKASAEAAYCATVGESADVVTFTAAPPPVSMGSLTLVPCAE